MTFKIGFLVIGAQKAGTTALFEYLRRHPEIHMPVEKDIAFFNRPGMYERGPEWYMATVTRGAPPGAVCGEASTYYMGGTPYGDIISNEQHSPAVLPDEIPLEDVVPRRIRELLPGVKLVCVLRDPISRAFSHHRMMTLEKAESRSFEEMVSDVLEPDVAESARRVPTRTNNYLANGEYGRILAGYLRVFPREQLLVIPSKHLSQDPAQGVRAVFEFVGVDPEFLPENIETKYRVGAEKERIKGLSLDRLQLRVSKWGWARKLWHTVPNGFRERIDRAFRVASYRVVMWNAKRGVTGDEITDETRRRLVDHFRPDGEALEKSLNQPMPWLRDWPDA